MDGLNCINYVITDTGSSCYDASDGHTIFNNPIRLEIAKKFKNFYNDDCIYIDICDKYTIHKYSDVKEDYYFIKTTKNRNEISHISINMKTNKQVMKLYGKIKKRYS